MQPRLSVETLGKPMDVVYCHQLIPKARIQENNLWKILASGRPQPKT